MSLCDDHGVEFARGLVNCSSVEVTAVKGKTSRVAMQLGFAASLDEIVHRWVCGFRGVEMQALDPCSPRCICV